MLSNVPEGGHGLLREAGAYDCENQEAMGSLSTCFTPNPSCHQYDLIDPTFSEQKFYVGHNLTIISEQSKKPLWNTLGTIKSAR